MSRRFLIPTAAVAALVVLGAAGAYAYFFSGFRTSPPTLALASPSPTASQSPTTSSSGPGAWQITSGSLVGYRVKEQFAGQASTHEAVARTGDVTGLVTITQKGTSFEMTSAKVTVQLANLASVDSVAGYNVRNRDGIVQRALSVSSFPTAIFEAENVALPADVETGQQVTVTVPGRLTVHGVTKSVTATLQLRVVGGTAQIAGSIATNMTDFGVNPPSVPFTVVQPQVTIELSLNLTQGA